MKRIYWMALLLITYLYPVVAEPYHRYQEEEVATFSIGKERNEFMYKKNHDPGANAGPSSMAFSKEGELFISDTWNYAIKGLNQLWSVEEVIGCKDEYYNFLESYFLEVDTATIFGMQSSNAYGIVNRQGEKVIEIDFHLDSMAEIREKDASNVVSYKRYIFQWLKDGGIVCFYKEGEETKEVRNEEVQELIKNDPRGDLAGLSINEENRLFIEGRPLTRDYKTYIQYFLDTYNIEEDLQYRDDKRHIFRPLKQTSGNLSLIGEDSDGNWYWDVLRKYVFIFNKEGWVLDVFQYDDNISSTLPAVHPSGDIYFLDYDTEGVYLYRIENVWDAEGRGAWYESAGESSLNYVDGVVNDDRVRVRTAPNLESDTLGYVNRGDAVMIKDETKELMKIGDMEAVWYRIGFEGKEGWVYGWFVDKK
ncbi:SH3 domain-containing protein [Sediminispirochaeta bajacaliforniensis]|uniref:SH3 domain-containing protein n=1 Tax=Sediminispirochaeta bajacaliforniensis TaxID=148 RepID=UPI0003767383|nr:SH3 domain-containing protein [Sediminispirochaeta bajacaliforniensis]